MNLIDEFNNKYLSIIEDENQNGYYSYCDKLKEAGLLPENTPYPKFLCMNFPTKITLIMGLLLSAFVIRIVYNPNSLKCILMMAILTLAIFFIQGLYSTFIYYILPVQRFENKKKTVENVRIVINKEKRQPKIKVVLKSGQNFDFYLNIVKSNTKGNQLTTLFETLISKIKESEMNGQKLYRYTNIYIKEIAALIIDLEKNYDQALYKEVYGLVQGLINNIDNEREEAVKTDRTNFEALKKFMSKKGDI